VRFAQYAVFVETVFVETAEVIGAKFHREYRVGWGARDPNFRRVA
jgi:hypothetical protein